MKCMFHPVKTYTFHMETFLIHVLLIFRLINVFFPFYMNLLKINNKTLFIGIVIVCTI